VASPMLALRWPTALTVQTGHARSHAAQPQYTDLSAAMPGYQVQSRQPHADVHCLPEARPPVTWAVTTAVALSCIGRKARG
jgi:hypothetical protein